MGKPRFIAGVDIGSTKICALAAEVTPGGRLRMLSTSTVPAAGIQKGAVVDLETASGSVAKALNRVAMETHRKIEGVLLGTSAAVASLNSRGSFTSSRPDEPITLQDARKAVMAATDTGLPSTRQVLHAIPRRFAVDALTEVSNPVGLFGRRIDTDAHIVTTAGPGVRALIACIERWGTEVEGVVAQSLAAAQAVLTPEERDHGVVVADLGAGSSGVTIFVDSSPWHTATVPIGGRHVTQDLAVILGIPFDEAEEMKISAGHAVPATIETGEELDILVLDGDAEQRISRRELCEIVEARVRELIGLIDEEIRRSGYAGLLPAGLVLTGGTAQLPGIARVASEMLGCRVRIGQPTGISDGGLCGPEYASAVGLLLWGGNSPSRRWWTYPAQAERNGEASRSSSDTSRWWKSFWPPVLGGARSEQRWS